MRCRPIRWSFVVVLALFAVVIHPPAMFPRLVGAARDDPPSSTALVSPEAPLAPATPMDTPTVIVDDNPTDWTVGSGLVYWTWANPEARIAYLRRMPTHGGVTRTLDEDTRPYRYEDLAADDSGVYYYRYQIQGGAGANRIEGRPTNSPGNPATSLYNTSPGTAPVTRLSLDASSVYWGTSGQYIMRVGKDATNPTSMVTTEGSLTDILVTNSDVLWLDSGGLWKISKTCSPLPCSNKRKLLDTQGGNLMTYGRAIYWVETAGRCSGCDFHPQTIRRLTCSAQDVCTPGALYTTAYEYPEWQIGQLATNGTFLFWKESSGSNARLRRLRLDGSGHPDELAADLYSEGDGNYQHVSPAHIYTDDLGVYFLGRAARIVRLPFNARIVMRDLKAEAWEVTQAIQSLENDVPLVANKTTYVRVYGKEVSGPTAGAVAAVLHGSRNGVALPGSPLWPINGTRFLATYSGYDRADLTSGWLFQLPGDWTSAGVLNLRAELDPSHVYPDPDLGNNVLSNHFAFVPIAPICPVIVPVRTRVNGQDVDGRNDYPAFWGMIDHFTNLWPVSRVSVSSKSEPMEKHLPCFKEWHGIPYPAICDVPFDMSGDFVTHKFPLDGALILSQLLWRATFSSNPPECPPSSGRTYWVAGVNGMTPRPTGVAGMGLPGVTSNLAWLQLPDPRPHPLDLSPQTSAQVMAQELGHNNWIQHIRCPGTDITNPAPPWELSYPYPVCQLDAVGPDRHYGFDAGSRRPITPNTATDFMSYGTPVWVSDYTWRKLFSKLGPSAATRPLKPANEGAVSGPDGRRPALPDLAASNLVVMASGVITTSTQQATLDYAWTMPVSALNGGLLEKWQMLAAPSVVGVTGLNIDGINHPDIVNVTYHLRVSDPHGVILDDRAFIPPSGSWFGSNVYGLTFPAPGGAVGRLDLMLDNTILASLHPGVNTPRINITRPTGGETFDSSMTISWQASDDDSSDVLLYTIQYSPDNGATWQSIVNNMSGDVGSTGVTRVISVRNGLAGSQPNGGLIRVLVSDGYHTAVATSRPFTVTNRAPEPYILSPMTNEWGQPVQSVSLRGGATDAEDGTLSDGSLHWTVNNMANGTGQEQRVDGLAPGSHDVALTARDSRGQEQTVHAPLYIPPLHIPVGQEPVLNGVCDDDAYRTGLQLQLHPYAGGQQATVYVIGSDTALWVCFSGLKRSRSGPGGFVGGDVDVNNSRDALVQPDDYGFTVREDGTPSVDRGDGRGNYVSAGVTGLQARTSADDVAWNAELRIDSSVIGGWNHVVGLQLGHYWVSFQGDDYHWPYLAGYNQPNTWAVTELGDVPGRRLFLPLVSKGRE